MDISPFSLPPPFKHSLPQGRNNDPSIPKPRSASEQISPPRKSIKNNVENRSPCAASAGIESMLRTSTETGDIGMFSIKPSRIPQALGNPRSNNVSYIQPIDRSPHNFQPYGVPIDDRRRLPSYARSSNQDLLPSLSRRAPRSTSNSVQSSPNGRSYSLTQSTPGRHPLTTQQSFSSLRSHFQQNNPYALQRPRSPFAYPTRLRRPGFRPASPALTDGGVVDYSRRAEIERFPNVSLSQKWYLCHYGSY